MLNLNHYVHSMRHLKPIQVWGRVRRIAQQKGLHRSSFYRSSYLQASAKYTPFLPLQFSVEVERLNSEIDRNIIDEMERGIFTFLNHRVELGEPLEWLPTNETQLWKYNLHYFDYTTTLIQSHILRGNPQAYRLFRRLVNEWIVACPVATPIAWDSYPISLRICNWLRAYTFFEPLLQDDQHFAADLRRSLYSQSCFLEDHLEYHLLGNHLIENGRALLFAGLFFAGKRAEEWKRLGKQILWSELCEQFLGDGGHFERSPMYHQIMLHLYQEVTGVLKVQGHIVPPEVNTRIQKMESWLDKMLHPDGQIALFNDAAFGIAGDSSQVLANLSSQKSTNRRRNEFIALPESGYFIFRSTDTQPDNPNISSTNHRAQHSLIFDCGPLGPDYFPSHGHCDALSYELSLDGQRFIVDTGVGNYYGDLDWRLYYRSTRAHNTIVVDGAEQSEIWDRFRVGRRAQPLDVKWSKHGNALVYVSGAHSGYQRLDGEVTHRRWVCWVNHRFWLVFDQITGEGQHNIESLLHFHPEVEILQTPQVGDNGLHGEVKRGSTHLQVIPWGVEKISTYYGETEPIQGWMSPEFGLRIKNRVWGLQKQSILPSWLGYLLWPEAAEVSSPVVTMNEQFCCIEIASNDTRYRIECDGKNVSCHVE